MDNLLDKWKIHLLDKNKGYWLDEDTIDKYISLLKKYIGIEYFEIKPKSRPGYKKLNEQWLKFLLSNNYKNYTFAAIEFCQVLEVYEKKLSFENYLISKLKTKKGKIHPQLFKGNYHELFTAFLFKTNGIEYIPDLKGEKTIYDGISRHFGKAFIVECTELQNEEELLKLQILYISILDKIQKYFNKNLIFGKGNNRPLINGYFKIKDIKTAIDDFQKHIKIFQKDVNKNPIIKEYRSGEICIEDYKKGLFENYKFDKNELAIKFTTNIDLTKANINLECNLPNNEKDILERIIQSCIKSKRKQHKNSEYNYKIISISITTYPFSRLFDISLIHKYKSRILSKIKDDTIVLFIFRNLLMIEEYDIQVLAIGDNKFEPILTKLNSLQLKFIK